MTRSALIVCLPLLLAAGSAAAQRQQEPAPPDDGLFIDSVDVNVVNVDVYVTDKKGTRITGLTKDDFEIFEDKRPVAVTNFYAVEAGKPTTPLEEEVAPAPGPASEPGRPAPPPGVAKIEVPEDQRLRLVVYIDNFNIHPFNRNRVMRELRAFINGKLTRDDLVMLVSYDRSLHIRRTFTSDHALIGAALGDLEKVSGHAVHHESERRDALERIEETESPVEAMAIARSFASSTHNDLSFSIDALKDIVNALAGMPGRKAILYVSDGLPMIAGEDVFHAVEGKFGGGASTGALTEAFRFDTSRRFRELTASANANRVTFYTIDAAGLRVASSISAENRGGSGQGVFIDGIRVSNLQSTLQMMAETTGGVAIINSNIVGPKLERVADDFGSYYSLGYTPPHSGDGRFHAIEVKVKRKGLVVRHREGYRDKSPETRMTDGTLAALNFPYEDNPLGVELEFGQAARREDGYFVQQVAVKIPIGRLTLVPRSDSHDASVRVFVSAMDDEGGTSDVQQVQVPIKVPVAQVEAAKGQFYTYALSLMMRGGEHKVAVGVRDEVGSQASFVSRSVMVGRAR